MRSINVHLEAFEGPFDLLFHLIEKNEIDIYDIPIAQLTEQYIAFLDQAEYKNMDNMSEFLIMAATLIEIKSKLLLPKQKQEQQQQQDPREELVNKLLEYKKFKEITEDFKKREEIAALVLYKEADKAIEKLKQSNEENVDLEKFLCGITLNNLYEAFTEVMKRRETKVDRVRSSFKSVQRDLYTIDEKIDYIRDLLILRSSVSFYTIFRSEAVKMEIVVTFLALLELIKMKEVSVSQKETFSEILITKVNGSDNNEIDRV
ncbi:segregation/condensation protein A [Clostridium sp. MD294]|uniref:segregation and condensation protein A n=1 Tax=Clostridium sp. MD294 TaxID=97138 RepID=UPI0002CC8759|nr:segregation/condensation protein A [Clostridium sp. MD294]USF30756.1 Segregation and condensation protein A [Clostridium sp. MD294]